MMSLFVRLFIKDSKNISDPNVKKKFAVLSSAAGIVLNLFLCIVKFVIGNLSNSISISADGFNNLSDAGTSLVSLLGFKIAGYGRGYVHPFGHGRIEWIMGLFTSIIILLMGIKLADTSFDAIINQQKTVFSNAVVVVLVISIIIKVYMYCYNKKFAVITDSAALKATAADCISDCAATGAVLFSAVISYITGFEIDGYCGVLVSVFIIFTAIKSLWEILGRIMGKVTNKNIIDTVMGMVKQYAVITDVRNLMVHDYGFGYFIISMCVEGHRKDSDILYDTVNEISYNLYRQFHCDCFIQIGHILENETLAETIKMQIYDVLEKYNTEIKIENLRLIDNGSFINIAFDMVYPAEFQKDEEKICRDITEELESESLKYRVTIKSIIRREHFGLHK